MDAFLTSSFPTGAQLTSDGDQTKINRTRHVRIGHARSLAQFPSGRSAALNVPVSVVGLGSARSS
jgi:hypothetical protein